MLKKDLSALDIPVYYTVSIPLASSSLEPVVNDIMNHLYLMGLIISLIGGPKQDEFITYLEKSYIVPPNFQLYIFDFDTTVLKTVNAQKYNQHYLVTQELGSNNDIDILFKKYYNDYYPYVNRISSNMYYAATSLLIWKDAVEYQKSYTYSSLLSAINSRSYNTPLGVLSFGKDHHLNIPRKIVKISAGEYTAIFNSGNIQVDIYGAQHDSVTLICDWTQGGEVEKESFAVICVFDPINNKNFFEIYSVVVSEIEYINSIGGLLGMNMIIKNIFYTEGDNDLGSRLQKSMEDDYNFLYIGCITSFCLNTIMRLLEENGKALVYPKPFKGELCHRSIFFTGPIPNQIIEPLFNHLDSESKTNIIILYSPSNDWNKYYEILKNSFSQTRYTIVYENAFEDSELFSYNLVTTIVEYLHGSGVIISLLSEGPISSFLEIYQYISYLNDDIDFFSLRVNPRLLDISFTLPVYYISTEDDVIPDNQYIINLKNTLQTYVGFNSVVPESISIAIIFSLIFEGLKQINIDDIFNGEGILVQIIQRLYSISYDQGVSAKLDTSNYMERDIYIYEYTDSVSVLRKYRKYRPEVYNWKIQSNYQKKCNWGMNSVTNVIKALLLTSNTGSRSNDYKGINEAFQTAVRGINREGGVLNSQFEYKIVDYESDDLKCSSYLKTEILTQEYSVIFTTAHTECLTPVLSLIEQYKIKVISIGLFGGEFCDKSVIFSGLEPSSLDTAINFFVSQGEKNFGIIGTTDVENVKFTSYAEKYIEYVKGNVILLTNLDETSGNVNGCAANIYERLGKGSVILFFGTVEMHVLLSKALSSYGVTGDYYVFVSFSTSENAAAYNILPFYAVNHYFNSIDTAYNNAFLSGLSGNLPAGIPISSIHENIYTLTTFWINLVNTFGIKPENLELEYYQHSFASPIGDIRIGKNNNVIRRIYIEYYDGNSNGKFVHFFSYDIGEPKIWKTLINNGMYECDLTDEKKGEKSKCSSVKIAVVAPLTGKNNKAGYEILGGISLAVDEINSEGGILNNLIEIEIVDTKSDSNVANEVAEQISVLKDVSFIFGGLWSSDYYTMSEVFSRVGKLVFFTGISPGEECDSYTISVQSTLEQLISLTKSIYTNENTDYIILYSSIQFNTIGAEIISSLLGTLYLNYEKYLVKDYDEVFTSIVAKYPNGATVLDMSLTSSIHDLIIPAYNYGVVPPKFKWYHFTVKEDEIQDYEMYFEGHYFIAPWFDILGRTGLKKYKNGENFVKKVETKYYYALTINALLEASYTSVKLWNLGVKETGSFDAGVVRTGMYKIRQTYTLDSVQLETNNILSKHFYIVTINNGKYNIVEYPTGLISAYGYSSWIPKNENKACDWVEHSGYWERDNIIHLAIILEKDYLPRQDIYTAWLSFDRSIDEINKEGGISGHYISIYTRIIDMKELEESTELLLNSTDVKALFGCLSYECRDIVSKLSYKYKSLFFYIGDSEGEFFSLYTITVGATIKQKLQVLTEYSSQFFIYYYILIDSEYKYLFF